MPNLSRRFLSVPLVGYLAGVLLLLSIITGCNREDTRSVTVSGYNYTERPIYTFSVNGVGISNIFVDGGGGTLSCCTPVTVGKPVEIKWLLSYTKKQYEEGIRDESFSTTVVVPPPTVPDAEYLEVHFYPDNHVELALVHFPGDRRIPYVEKED